MNINRLGSNCVRTIGLLVAIGLLSITAIVGQEPARPDPADKSASQKTEASPRNEKNTPKPPFTLSVKTKPILNLSLKAEKARLSEVAEEMAKRLKVQVFVGTSLKDELVSIEFSELTLEPAMQLMAPAVYIDYEIDSGSGMPKPLGIFFYGENQGEPPLTAVIPGSTQSLLIEGDTEDGVEPQNDDQKKKQEEQPLRVHFEDNNISVKAKKQPLPLILLKIGEELGIPVDIQYDTKETVDTEITKLSVEDAVRKLSPNVRLFLRADLTHAERRVLRLVLTDPTKSAQQGL
ncbi:MAG: hypothetical protein DMF69_02955 [Acidobacteria bacterium]|nr:MAG: hypothetical protein DMF69_02955 [Acidobacteriota bacterium]